MPMTTGNGWYLAGPLIAVGLVGFLGAVFWRMGLHWTFAREGRNTLDDGTDPYAGGLAIFGDPDDYGLLCPVAVTDDPDLADEIRRLLGDAGIRATQVVDDDGRTAVLVFAEEVEEARRLVGGSPAL
jgi:hypothetical protein